MPTEKRYFLKGMDKDSDERTIENGWYRDAVDFRITDYNGGQEFNGVSIKGNTEISYTLNSGLNKGVGGYDDKLNRYSYVFIWNSENDDLVLRLDYRNSTISKVLEGDLGFEQDTKVTGVDIIQNRFLVWVDNLTEPKVVDLNRLSDYPTITSSNQYYINLIKEYTLEPIFAEYFSNTTYNQNNLNNKQFKFRTRLIYKGGFKSVPSTISNCPVPKNIFAEYEETNPAVTNDNEISLKVKKPTDEVQYVEVLAQSGASDEAMGNWRVVKTIDTSNVDVLDYPSDSNYWQVTFRNDGIYVSIDQAEAAELFSRIPLTSRALAQIESNRILFGNCVVGFDNVEADIDVTPTYISYPVANVAGTTITIGTGTVTKATAVSTAAIPSSTGGGVYTNDNFGFSYEANSPAPVFRIISVGGTPEVGDLIQLNVTVQVTKLSPVTNYTANFTIKYLVTEEKTKEEVASELLTAINTTDTIVEGYGMLGFLGVNSSYEDDIYVLQGLSVGNGYAMGFTATATVSNISNELPKLSFKKGATHEIAMHYIYEGGRISTVQTSANATTYVAMDNERGVGSASGKVSMNVQINHTPPSDAIGYYLVHKQQRKLQDFLYFTGAVNSDSVGTYIDFSDIRDFNKPDSAQTYASSTSVDWAYVEGDRIILTRNTTTGKNINGLYDFRITYYDTDARKAYINADLTTILDTAGTALVDTNTVIFKVYRPEKEVDVALYNEFGYKFDIENGFHKGNTQDQTATLPAIIDITDYGDVYFKRRVFLPSATSFYVESKNMSDFYESSATSSGRLNVQDKTTEQRREQNRLYFTQPYTATNVESPLNNGLSLVFGLSFGDLNTEYGSIQGLVPKTRRVVVFFERKKGFMPINEDTSGNQLTFSTENVLNNIQYYSGDYGVGESPESIVENGNAIYSVDPVRGTVNRLAENGDTPISQYKMRGFFNEKLNSASNKISVPEIWGVLNKNFDEYTISIREKTVASGFANSGGVTFLPNGTYNLATSDGFGTTLTSPLTTFYVLMNSATAAGINVGDLIDFQYTLTFDRSAKVLVNSKTLQGSGLYLIELTTSYIGSPISEISLTALGDIISSVYNVVTFSESNNAWTNLNNYEPDCLIESGMGYSAVKDGVTYTQETNDLYCNNFGVQNKPSVTMIFNEESSTPKVFTNIQVEGNGSVFSNEITTPSGQESSIAEADFEEYQNQFFAPLLNDENTPNVIYPLINGDDLRGVTLKAKLLKDTTEQLKIYSVGVKYFPVNLSNDV